MKELSKAGSEAGGSDRKLGFGDLLSLRINQMYVLCE